MQINTTIYKSLPEPRGLVSPEQFVALAKLMRARASNKSRQAAFLHLVERVSVGEAAQRAGISPNAASHAIRRARTALKLAYIVAGKKL